MSYIKGKKAPSIGPWQLPHLDKIHMAVSGYTAKIKNFRNAVFYIPFDPEFYTDHVLRTNHILKINS